MLFLSSENSVWTTVWCTEPKNTANIEKDLLINVGRSFIVIHDIGLTDTDRLQEGDPFIQIIYLS